jgi:SAM-dependent methyltransferase
MKKTVQTIFRYLNLIGIDPVRAIMSIRGFPAYLRDYLKLKQQQPIESSDRFEFGKFFPCLGDRYFASGSSKGHYFHQDLLVASKIFSNNPRYHIDVGSRVDGFVAHVASFRELAVIDIRQPASQVRNITFLQADLMKDLPIHFVESCDSLSCLHALEHFGLGRYGDPVCWDGYRIGFINLISLLKPGGKLYLSVPIGRLRIEFNAHRIFSITHLLNMFVNQLKVETFSFVDDDGDLHEDVPLNAEIINNNCGCNYGCGIFELTKL